MTAPITNIIADVSNTALKYWLRSNNLQHSAANEDVLVKLLEKLIEKGDLTAERLRAGVREIEEHGGKRVYLRQITDLNLISDKRKFERHLAPLEIELSDEPTKTIKLPPKPRLNYACWLPDEIRIKFSERHIHLKPDRQTRQWREVPVTKYVVLSAELGSGFTKILIDPPGEEHLHLNERGVVTDAAYINYYFDLAQKIFGELEDFELVKRTQRLLRVSPPVYDIRFDGGVTPDNYRYSFRGRSDVRFDRAYQTAVHKNSSPGLPENIYGYWLQDESADQLQRDLFMQIRPVDSMLRFRADCLEHEVGYAISRIRSV